MSDPTVSGTAVTRLAAIRARLEAAPRGPWVVEHLGENGYPQWITNGEAILIAQCFEEPTHPLLTISPFLAAARTDVEVLLAAAEAALAGHEPQQVYEDALDLRGRALCDHDPDDIDSDGRHDQSEDGYWICLDKPLPSVCRGCPEVDGERPVWPCEPYKAVAGALGIETKERADDPR